MRKQITIGEVFELVDFTYSRAHGGGWVVASVKGDVVEYVGGDIGGYVGGDIGGSVGGDISGDVSGDISGDVSGDVFGDVCGNVRGDVRGTINGNQWESVETQKKKVERLIKETGNTELLEAFNQLEENS